MGSVLFVALFGCVLLHSTHAVRVPVADGRAIIPADSVKCIATRETPEDIPVVDCETVEPDSDQETFATNSIINLSLPFAKCEITPSSTSGTGFGFDCSGFPPVELEKPVVQAKNRTVTLSEGAVSCEVTGLQRCRKATPVAVNCKGAARSNDSPRFGKGVVFQFPEDGSSRCEITAGPDGNVIQTCLGSPPLTVAEPVVDGDEVTLPPGATNCEVAQGEDNKPVVNCTALVAGCKDPVFAEGATVELPADFGTDTTCNIEALADGEPEISCKSPPKVPIFKVEEGTLSIPEGITSCEVTGLEECVVPNLTKASCKYGTPDSEEPKFGRNAIFKLPKGFSSCVLTPGEGDDVIDDDCTPTPPSATILKETISGRSITLPIGAVSCTVTPTEEEDDFDVECIGPTEGCNDPEFEEETITELPEVAFASCTVTPKDSGPFVACTTSE